LTIDDQKIDLKRLGPPGPDRATWARFERIGERWRFMDALSIADRPLPAITTGTSTPSASMTPARSIQLPGPMMDLRWDRVVFCHGTLGDDPATAIAKELAVELSARWTSGRDSLQPHPGDRSVAIEYPVVADGELTDEQLSGSHVVLIGSPRTNAALARFRCQLPIDWSALEDDEVERSRFHLEDQSFDDPRDVALALCPHPLHSHRYVLVITANDPRQLWSVGSLVTAFLPDYLVCRSSQVVNWGYFDANWSLAERVRVAAAPLARL
jgi:hypothetical protein